MADKYDADLNPIPDDPNSYVGSDGKVLKRSILEVAPPKSSGLKHYDANLNEIIDYDKLQPGPQLQADDPLHYYGRKLVNELPNILGTGGDILGGPLGGAAGGFVGSAIKNYPQFFGGDKTDAVTNVLKDTAEQGAMPLIAPALTEGAGKLGQFIGTHGASIFSKQVPQDLLDATHSFPGGMPTSVGQETGSGAAKLLERSLAPGKQRELYGIQNELLDARENELRQQLTGMNKTSLQLPSSSGSGPSISNEEFYGNEGKAAIQKNFDASKANMGKKYGLIDRDAEASKLNINVPTGETQTSSVLDAEGNPTVTPEMKQVEIKGPIMYPQTGAIINKILPELQTTINRLPQDSPNRNRLVQLASTMQDLGKGIAGEDGSTTFVKDWNTIKQFRTDVYRSLNTTLPGDTSRAQGGLKLLADSLGKDIDTSVKSVWDKVSPGSSDRMADALSTSRDHFSTFNDRIQSSAFGTPKRPADASTIFNTAKTNPEAAGEMIKSLGTDGQRSIRGAFFDDIIKNSRGNPIQSLQMLDSPSYRRLFSASDYSDMSNFFKTIQTVQPDASQMGKYSIAVRGAGVAIGLGGSLLTGHLPISTGIGASVILGGNQFAERVLLNPKIARQASRLAQIDPGSAEATIVRRTILGAMRGTKVLLDYGDGEKKPATIGANGSVNLENQ